MNGKREEDDDEEKEIDEKEVERNVLNVEEKKSAPSEREEEEEEKSAPSEREEEEEEESAPSEREQEKVPEATREAVVIDKQVEQPERGEEEVVQANKEVSVHTDQEAVTEIVTNQVTVTDTTVTAVCQTDSQRATETVDPNKARPQEHFVSEEGLKPDPPTDASPKEKTQKHNENVANPLGEAVVTETRSGPPTQPPPPPPNVSHANSMAATPNRYNKRKSCPTWIWNSSFAIPKRQMLGKGKV